jgi:hypothetical protein
MLWVMVSWSLVRPAVSREYLAGGLVYLRTHMSESSG